MIIRWLSQNLWLKNIPHQNGLWHKIMSSLHPPQSPDFTDRALLGCVRMGDSRHRHTADKSTATMWCYYGNMEPTLWGMFSTLGELVRAVPMARGGPTFTKTLNKVTRWHNYIYKKSVHIDCIVTNYYLSHVMIWHTF